MVVRAGDQPASPPVGEFHQRLPQEEAFFGNQQIDPALHAVADNHVAVRRGVEPHHREGEASLAVLAGMAGSAIAARLVEDGEHMFGEADGWVGDDPLDQHLDGAGDPFMGDGEGGLAIADRLEIAGGRDGRHGRVGDAVLGVGREIDRAGRNLAGGIDGGDQQLGPFEIAIELHLRGSDHKLGRQRGGRQPAEAQRPDQREGGTSRQRGSGLRTGPAGR